MRSPTAAGIGFIACAALLWGSLGMLSRKLGARGVTPLEIAFFRALIGSALFAAHAVAIRATLPRGRDLAFTVLFGLVGISLLYGALQVSIDAGGIGLAVVLLYTSPVFVVALAWLVFKERPQPASIALALGVVAGVLCVSIGGGVGFSVSPRSIGWGLVAGFCFATYFVFGRTVLVRQVPVAALAIALPVGALGLLPFVSFSQKSLSTWALLGPTCALTTYLAILAYSAGIRRLDPVRASVTAALEPVVALVLAALVGGERPSPLSLAGAVLLVLAVAAGGAVRRPPAPT